MALIRGIDHLVILVAELDAAIARYRELGFTVTPGGRHPRATENALVSFRDGSYLELIAFWDTSDHTHPFHRFIATGPGLIAYALGVDDLDGTIAALNARGIAYGASQAGARRRPDGIEVAWKTAFPRDHLNLGLPFLIEDVTDRSLRVPGGTATEHANGALGIDRLIVVVRDLPSATTEYEGLLGAASTEPSSGSVDQSQPTRVTAIAVGPHRIELHVPEGEGSMKVLLATRGAGPYTAVLEGATAGGIRVPEISDGG